MLDRLPLFVILAAVGARVGAALSPESSYGLGLVVSALTTGFAAFLIPPNDRRVKVVVGRVMSCTLIGGMFLAPSGDWFYWAVQYGAATTSIIVPVAVALTRVQEWTESVRENSALKGFHCAALCTAFLGVLALIPWGTSLHRIEGNWRLQSGNANNQMIALLLMVAVALPAFMISLQTIVLRERVRTIEKLLEHATSSQCHPAHPELSAFDIGVGTTERVIVNVAQSYRHQVTSAFYCRGDGALACGMLEKLGMFAAAVTTIAALHAAAVLAGSAVG